MDDSTFHKISLPAESRAGETPRFAGDNPETKSEGAHMITHHAYWDSLPQFFPFVKKKRFFLWERWNSCMGNGRVSARRKQKGRVCTSALDRNVENEKNCAFFYVQNDCKSKASLLK